MLRRKSNASFQELPRLSLKKYGKIILSSPEFFELKRNCSDKSYEAVELLLRKFFCGRCFHRIVSQVTRKYFDVGHCYVSNWLLRQSEDLEILDLSSSIPSAKNVQDFALERMTNVHTVLIR